jgi:hypothetical protein
MVQGSTTRNYNFAEDGLNATFDWTNPAKEAQKISSYCQ